MDEAVQKAAAQIANARRGVPQIKAFFDEPTFTASYVVHDPETRTAAIIDSVLDYDAASGRTSFASADAIIAYVHEHDLAVQWLLETHAHADHLSAAPYIQGKVGGKLAIGRAILEVQEIFGKVFNEDTEFARDGSQFDRLFDDGDQFTIGNLQATVLHVPGHTPADLAYVIGDAAFVGDTLFMPDYGTARADFPGGDARTLFRSIRRLLTLPPETRLFLCHDYKAPGRYRLVWETTVAAQRGGNVQVLLGAVVEALDELHTWRDATLDMPKLILPSIQVNMRGGRLPEPEDNGTRYLKIPLDAV